MKERERDEPVLLRETSFTIKTLTHNVYIYFDTRKNTHTNTTTKEQSPLFASKTKI